MQELSQEEFNAIVQQTLSGEPVVVTKKKANLYIGKIGEGYAFPDELEFLFNECELQLLVQDTFQTSLTIKKCNVGGLSMTTAGKVRTVRLDHSEVDRIYLVDGSGGEELHIDGGRIGVIESSESCFDAIVFDKKMK